MNKKENKDCFVIMPISDTDGYDKGHFSRVYEDIIKPAVANTDFLVTRADKTKQTNLIQLDILEQLIDAPIVICDLSSRNPNVLFELGIRQAFNKPVVLIQEEGTPKIFDINSLRCLNYSKNMQYHNVLKTQTELTEAINATKKAEGKQGNINSIVGLMALSNPAVTPTLEGDNKEAFKQLNKDAQEELEKIKQHEKTAKQGVENISELSDKVKQTLLNPKKTLSKEILKEVKQSGTKLEKMTTEARQLEQSGNIQAAIDLWQQILGITKYQSNKEGQADAYFYLGYLYGKNAIDYEKSIAFSNKAIKIKPDYHGAYNNIWGCLY
jgi:tetratricopeptide (TPR) repeat protein